MNYKSIIKPILILGISLFPLWAQAQTDPGDPGGDPDAPIDGGVSVLIGAAVVYGARRLRQVKDSRKAEDKGNDHSQV